MFNMKMKKNRRRGTFNLKKQKKNKSITNREYEK